MLTYSRFQKKTLIFCSVPSIGDTSLRALRYGVGSKTTLKTLCGDCQWCIPNEWGVVGADEHEQTHADELLGR